MNSAKSTDLIFRVILICLLLFFLLAWHTPSYWNWSVLDSSPHNILDYLIFLLAALLIVIPHAGKSIYQLVSKAVTGILYLTGKLPGIIRIILWVILPGTILFLIKGSSYIYGDGHLIINALSEDTTLSSTAPGYEMLVRAIGRIFDISSWEHPEYLPAWISIICGIACVYFLYRILSLLVKEQTYRILSFMAISMSGLFIIFTGYVETYSLLISWLAVYIFLALRYYAGRGSMVWPILAFIIGIFWHIWFVAFLPSLLYIINVRRKIIPDIYITVLTIIYIIGMIFAGTLVTRAGITPIIPIINNTLSNYSLLSGQHLLDFFNLIIIVGPALTFLGIYMLLFFRNRDNTAFFSALIYFSLPALVIAFFIDPALGAARDWDMLSFFALPLMILAVISWNKYSENSIHSQAVLIPVILLGIFHFTAFVDLNRNTDLSVDRMIRILKEDRHYSVAYYNGERVLPFASILSNVYNRYDDAIVFTKRKALDGVTNYFALEQTADQYFNQYNFEKALEYYDMIPPQYLMDMKSRNSHAISLIKLKEYERAIVMLKGIISDSASAEAYSILGNAYLWSSLRDSADIVYREGLIYANDTALYLSVAAKNYHTFQYYDDALAYYSEALKSSPEYPEANLGYADTWLSKSQVDSANTYFIKCLEIDSLKFEALLGHAYSEHLKGEYQKALDVLKCADGHYPRNSSILYWTGINMSKLNMNIEAIQSFGSVLKINPGNLDARYYLARELFNIRDYGIAEQHWKMLLTYDSTYANAYLGLAEIYDITGNNPEAYRSLKKLLSLNGDNNYDSKTLDLLKKYGLGN